MNTPGTPDQIRERIAAALDTAMTDAELDEFAALTDADRKELGI